MATRQKLPSIVYRSPRRGAPSEQLIYMERSFRIYEKLKACKRELKEAKNQVRELSRAVRILEKQTKHARTR
jgi:hypothetical protein